MRERGKLSRRSVLYTAAGSLALRPLAAFEEQHAFGIDALVDGAAMVRIRAGEFLMGSELGNTDEEPPHRVRITRDFEMGKFEVTQAQWETVMTDPHAKTAGRPTPQGAIVSNTPSHFKGASLPVDSVSWDDIQVFLTRLNARDTSHTYRLPTEAEWEYACKVGKPGAEPVTDASAWYKNNAAEQTHPAGEKQPTAWGLHDMRGNVSEWVQDWYAADYYGQSPAADPQGPESGSYRVYRGGCWFDKAEYCRPAMRRFDFPVSRFYNVGFRVVRTAK